MMRKSIILCLVAILIMGGNVFGTENFLRVEKTTNLFDLSNSTKQISCEHAEREYEQLELVHNVMCTTCNEKIYEEAHVDSNNDMCCDSCLKNIVSVLPSDGLTIKNAEISTNEIKKFRKIYKASVIPEISVEVLQNGNEYTGKWTNEEVTLQPVFEGNANVTAYQYKTYGDSNWAGTVTDSLKLNSNFDNQIVMQGINPAGTAVTSEFTTNKIRIDTVAPEVGTITSENVERIIALEITASDDLSGFKDYAITQSESEVKAWKSIINTDTGIINADVAATGTYYVWVRDMAGNISSPKTITLTKDIEPPTGSISVKEAYLREGKTEYVNQLDLTLQITVEDNVSKASENEIEMAIYTESEYNALSDESDIEWKIYQAENEWTLTNENMSETVYLILRDKAGNISKEIGIASAGNVAYKVYHYVENINNEYYTLYKQEAKTGAARRTITLENERIQLDGITYLKGSVIQNGDAVVRTNLATDGSTEIHLYYKRNTYTLTFNTNGGNSISGITAKYGSTITKPTNPTKTGYTFTGWNPQIPDIMPGENMLMVAKWELKEYTISYNLDNGIFQGNFPKSYNITNDDITLMNPVRPGFEFLGWTGTDLTEMTTNVTIPAGSIGDRSYTANWEKQTLKLATPTVVATVNGKKYNSGDWANSHVTTRISVEDIYGTEIESIQYSMDKVTWKIFNFASVGGLQKNGTTYYGIEGWTDTDGRNEFYYIKAVDKLGNETDEDDYATFHIRYDKTAPSAPTYTAFYKDERSKIYTSGTTAYGPVHTTVSATDEKSGISAIQYSFDQINWTTFGFNVGGGLQQNGLSAQGEENWTYVDGRNDTAYFRAIDRAGNIGTAYATFNIIYENEFEITLDPVGGTIETTTIAASYESTYGTLPTPTRTGYTFAGWYKESTYRNKITTATVVGIGPHTIYAKWTPVTYNITYDLAGGTLSATNPSTYTIESAAITLKNPTKLGQNFAGWTGTGLTSATTTLTIPTGSTGDRTYTATWVGAPYTVSYVDENNHIYNLRDVSATTASSNRMKYSITNGVVTVTAISDDGYGYTNGRVDLVAGTSYTFTCNTTGTYGSATEVFLMLNGSVSHYYRMESTNHTFTPTTSGTYWLRLDVNVAGVTQTFSNLCIKQNLTETKTVVYGDPYGTLSTVSRTGHTLKWYSDSALTKEITATSTVTTPSNHNLYAKWTPATYTVTFDPNGGNIADTGASSTTRKFTYGKLYGEGSGAIPEAEKTGYIFNGWYTASSGGTKITAESLVGTEVQSGKLYAQYLKDLTIASAEKGYSIYESTDKIPVGITTTYDAKGIVYYNGTALTDEISITSARRTEIVLIDTSSFYSTLTADTLYYLDFKMTYPLEKEYKNAVAFKKTEEIVDIVGIETYINGTLTTNDTIDYIENSIAVDNELTSTNAQITYKITVKNNSTTHYYKFRNMTDEAHNNTSSTYTTNINLADDINLDTNSEYTFEITYTYNSSISNNTHRQILTFVFEKSFEFTGTTQNMITVGNATNATQNNFGDFDVTTKSDSNHGTSYGTHDELYGDNGGKLEYNEEGALVLDSDNAIALLDIDQSMSVEDEYSLYMTIKGDTSQTGNGWPATIVSISEAASKYLSWVGFTNNYIHIYSYYAGSPKSNSVYNYEQAGFVSFNVAKYSNKKMNIQIVATRGGETKVYINGENVKTFSSGANVVSYQFATIGDLRPGRNLKFTGLVYDVGVYNRALTEAEVQENWNYANSNFSIMEEYE